MTSNAFRRPVALALAASMAALTFGLGVPTSAGANAQFRGRVVVKDGFTPRSGVVVSLVDVATESEFPSSPTDADGTFRIESAPAGAYAVLARTDEGAYLAASELELREGDNRPLQLVLDPGARPELVPGQTQVQGDKLPAWARGLIGGVLLISAYELWDKVTESEASEGNPL